MIEQLGSELIPVMAIGCTFLFLTIWVVMATIDSIYKTTCNTRLKERLVDRGVSASEIDLIIKAGMPAGETESESEYVSPAPPVKSRNAYPISS